MTTKITRVSLYPNNESGYVLTYKDIHISGEVRIKTNEKPLKKNFKIDYKGHKNIKTIKNIIDFPPEEDKSIIDIRDVCMEAQRRVLTQASGAYSLVQKFKELVEAQKRYGVSSFDEVLNDAIAIYNSIAQKRNNVIDFIIKNNLYDSDQGVKWIDKKTKRAVLFINGKHVVFKPSLLSVKIDIVEKSKLTIDVLKYRGKSPQDFKYVGFNNLDDILESLGVY